MKTKIKAIVYLASMITLSACSNPYAIHTKSNQDEASNRAPVQVINLNLITPRYTGEKFTHAPLELTVVDSRSYRPVGSIASNQSEKLMQVRTVEDVNEYLKNAFRLGLQAQGHAVKHDSTVGPEYEIVQGDQCTSSQLPDRLIVRLHNLLATSSEKNDIKANAEFEVNMRSCKNEINRFLDKNYTINATYNNKPVVLKEDIQMAVEDVLNEALDKILKDKELQKFMSNNIETIYYTGQAAK